MKQILTVAVMLTAGATLALAGAAAEEGGGTGVANINPPDVFPIAKERMELDILMSLSASVMDIHTNETILWIEEYTNIDLVIDAAKQNAREKVSLLLAAQQDLPDIFLTYGAISREQLTVYGEQGVFAPVTPYLEDGWLPNTAKALEYDPLMKPQLTMPDGNMYSFVRYLECRHCMHSQKLYMNTAWLERLGLAVPTTTDEFYDVLVAFRDQDANGNGDPSDEIPLLGMSNQWRTDFTGFLMQPFAPATLKGDLYLYQENGTIQSGMHHPGWPQGMAYLATLYAERLFDEEIFVMDRNVARALTGSPTGNRVGAIQAGYWGPFVNLGVPGAREEMNPIAPFKGVDGSRRTPFFRPIAAPRFVITTGPEEKVLAAMRLGDFHMTNPWSGDPDDLEIGLNIRYGPNGWIVPEGKLGLNGEPAVFEWTFMWQEPTNLNFAGLNSLFQPQQVHGTMAALGGDRWDGEKIVWDATRDMYEPYSVDMVVPPVVFPGDRASELGELKQILTDYMDENIANFIIGERDAATEWGDFLDELETLGFSTYLSAVQEAYDAAYK